MVIAIEPSFVERVVFEAMRADATLESRYHRELAACYDERDPDRRESAFRELHERCFDQLGFRKILSDALAPFPFIQSRAQRVAVAGGRGRPSADLFGKTGRYTVAIALTPELLRDESSFRAWSAFELQHIDDMLDPAFGFDAAAQPAGDNSAAQNLTRDRFAILWAISIDARLAARGLPADAAREKHARQFAQAFTLPDDAAARQAFNDLWDAWRTSRPTHQELLDRATIDAPSSIAGALTPRARPGDACPMCRFPTFDWADLDRLSAPTLASLQRNHPTWSPSDGLCGQCLGLLLARMPSAQPPRSDSPAAAHAAVAG